MAKNRRKRRLQEAEEVLRNHQGGPPPSRWWWWWVPLASSPRRWLHVGLGILRRASWVASSMLYRWIRRGPSSRGLVSDALATAVRHASSSARLPALTTVLAEALVGVEPSGSTTAPSALQEGVPEPAGHGSLAGVAPVAASPSTSPPEGSHGVLTTVIGGRGRCVDASTAEITSVQAVPAPLKVQSSTILERYTSGVLPPLRRLLQDTESFFQHMLFEEEDDNDDDDPEKKRYAIYLSHVAKTPKDSIICLMCFLEKGVSKTIPRSLVESHCVSRHNTPGIKCEKTGCMVTAKHKGDIGRHKYYCHDLKAGWWKILVEWS